MGATLMEQVDIAGLLANLAGLKNCGRQKSRGKVEGSATVNVMEGSSTLYTSSTRVLLVMWGKVKVTQGDGARSLIQGDHLIVEPGEYQVQCAKKSCILAAEFSGNLEFLNGH